MTSSRLITKISLPQRFQERCPCFDYWKRFHVSDRRSDHGVCILHETNVGVSLASMVCWRRDMNPTIMPWLPAKWTFYNNGVNNFVKPLHLLCGRDFQTGYLKNNHDADNRVIVIDSVKRKVKLNVNEKVKFPHGLYYQIAQWWHECFLSFIHIVTAVEISTTP